MKHAYNESANFIERYVVLFYFNGPLNLAETVPVIGMEGMVLCFCLLNTWDYYMPGICSLMKPAAKE